MALKDPQRVHKGSLGTPWGDVWRPWGYPRGILGAFGGFRGIPGVFLGDPWAPVGLQGDILGGQGVCKVCQLRVTAVLPGPTRLLSTLTASQLRARSLGLSAAMEPRGLSGLVGPVH